MYIQCTMYTPNAVTVLRKKNHILIPTCRFHGYHQKTTSSDHGPPTKMNMNARDTYPARAKSLGSAKNEEETLQSPMPLRNQEQFRHWLADKNYVWPPAGCEKWEEESMQSRAAWTKMGSLFGQIDVNKVSPQTQSTTTHQITEDLRGGHRESPMVWVSTLLVGTPAYRSLIGKCDAFVDKQQHERQNLIVPKEHEIIDFGRQKAEACHWCSSLTTLSLRMMKKTCEINSNQALDRHQIIGLWITSY